LYQNLPLWSAKKAVLTSRIQMVSASRD